jgi:glycosyltransferase involved in cell wall biosynthesis
VTIDIMMPFYGRPDHFRTAVESVLAQTSAEWRLVIVDDVYPDLEPGRWAAALPDPRVTYVRNTANLGVSGNFQKCVELADAEHLVLMGCDDVMGPRYVERISELIARFPDADLYQPGVDTIDQDGRPSRPLADRVKDLYRLDGQGGCEYSGERLAASLLNANWAYFPSLCWRTEQLKGRRFRDDLRVVQDLTMMLAIVREGGSMVVDDEVCFTYRRHSGSVSAEAAPDGSKFVEEAALFAAAEKEMSALGWHKAARAARLHVTSRLHAASDLPAAIRARSWSGVKALSRHALRF